MAEMFTCSRLEGSWRSTQWKLTFADCEWPFAENCYMGHLEVQILLLNEDGRMILWPAVHQAELCSAVKASSSNTCFPYFPTIHMRVDESYMADPWSFSQCFSLLSHKCFSWKFEAWCWKFSCWGFVMVWFVFLLKHFSQVESDQVLYREICRFARVQIKKNPAICKHFTGKL